jgi:repressor of nif and glnA expression
MAKERAITIKQRDVLRALNREDGPVTTQALDATLSRLGSWYYGYDALHATLKRLHARGLTKREGRPAKWSLTRKGEAALS